MTDYKTYIAELEARIQVLQYENSLFTAKAEENQLLSKAFEEINSYDDSDILFDHILESISILLDIQFSGIFEYNNSKFKCVNSYLIFGSDDLTPIFNISIETQRKLNEQESVSFMCGLDQSSLDFPDVEFETGNVLIIPLRSEIITNTFFVFVNEKTSQTISKRIVLLEKITNILAAKLDKNYYQDQLNVLNKELEKRVNERTSELSKLNKELMKSSDDFMESNERLKTIFENTPLGLIYYDENSEIVDCNQNFVDIIGSSKDVLIGFNMFKQLKDPSLLEAIKNSFTIGKGYFKGNYVSVTAEKVTPIRILYNGIKDKNNNIVGGIGIAEDITEQLKKEEELSKAKEKAEESDRLKTIFLNNLSHEVRTPMNGIMGFANLLNNSTLDDIKRKQYTEYVVNSSQRLMNIIDDIVEISRLETGLPKIEIRKFKLNELLQELYGFFNKNTNPDKLFHLEQGLSDEESTIHSDEAKLYKVLYKLLDNAFKFTKEGFVKLGYQLVNKKHDEQIIRQEIQIYIIDTGNGINSENKETIFEPFWQGATNVSQVAEGLGLGLSIAKAYTEILHGEISFESNINIGTTFKVSIPYNNNNDDIK